MTKKLSIESLSVASPQTGQEVTNIVTRHFSASKNVKDRAQLVVLPEYFIGGNSFANIYDGATLDDPRVRALENYAKDRKTHVAVGMVERTDDTKYISGLVFSPTRGLIAKRRKQTPTPFEMASGVTPGHEAMQPIELDNGIGKIAIAMCFEAFTLEKELTELPADIDILVNPRGFDLDDPDFGELSKMWLLRNRNLAMMGKRYVVGATGSMGKPGAMAEIIDFEGNVMAYTNSPNQSRRHLADLVAREDYLNGNYKSYRVPEF